MMKGFQAFSEEGLTRRAPLPKLQRRRKPGRIRLASTVSLRVKWCHIDNRLIIRSEADADVKERRRLYESARLPHTLPGLVFLGIDDRPDASKDSVPAKVDPLNPQGVPYFAIDAGKEEWVVEGAEFGDARASASSMSGWEAGVFAQARALIDWNCRNLVSTLLLSRGCS
jgi:hypothetical protein